MTAKELITILSKMDGDKVVIVTEPNGIGWDNIGSVLEAQGHIKILQDGGNNFHDK